MTINKRLLVFSADPLSHTSNNGKTIESFISKWDKEAIAQIYINEANLPESSVCKKYFKISDMDMLKRILWNKSDVGNIIEMKVYFKKDIKKRDESYLFNKLKKTNIARIFREILWIKGVENNSKLIRWVSEFNPQVLLFQGGDAVFSYKLALRIADEFGLPIIFQVTDEYLTRSIGLSISGLIRKIYLSKYFNIMIKRCRVLLTIGDEMKNEYFKKYQKESKTIMNSINIKELSKHDINRPINIVYAGSLYYGRDESLLLFIKALKIINKESVKIVLSIYTSTKLSNIKMLDEVYIKVFNIVSSCELEKIIENSDMLLFLECFKRKERLKTRLSISTKIPEYMASGRCIFALGPDDVSSIKYLKNVSVVCSSSNPSLISKELNKIVSNESEMKKLAKNAYLLAKRQHNVEDVAIKFEKIVNSID